MIDPAVMPSMPEYSEVMPFPVEEEKPAKVHKLIKWLDEGNIVSKMEDHATLTGSDVYEDIQQCYGDAQATMDKWLRKYKAAIALAKMQPTAGGEEIDSKDFPFPGASVAMMPFVLQSMLDFASRASPDLVWTEKLVSGQVTGMDREQSKMARAIRVET